MRENYLDFVFQQKVIFVEFLGGKYNASLLFAQKWKDSIWWA